MFDHSKHYAQATVGYYRMGRDHISPKDSTVTKSKNNPIVTIPNSKSILFAQGTTFP